MRVRLSGLLVVALSGSVFTSTAFAQTLAESVPADAVLYVGWRGTSDPGPGYVGSKWEAVLKDSQVNRLIDETLPAIGETLARRYPKQGEGPLARALATTYQHLIRQPSAIFFQFDGTRPRGGFLCRAGDRTPELTQALQAMANQMQAPVRARFVEKDGSVGLVFNYAPDDALEGGLNEQPAFKRGLATSVADPFMVTFLNLKTARERIDEAVATNATPRNVDYYRRAMAASGLEGVDSLTSASGFVDREWQTDTFVAAPAPRKGLLAFDDRAALDPALVDRVPASANAASVFRLNAGAAVKSIRDVANQVDPAAADMIDKGLGAATMAIGKNVENDLLASLGGEWAVYTSPDIGGTSGLGAVLVNKLTNPLKARQALASLSIFVTNSAKNLIKDKNISVTVRTAKVGDLTVYYAATPLVSPAYAVKDGFLYVGSFPQTVIAAAQHNGPSIATLDAFKNMPSPDGAKSRLSVTLTDVKSTIGDGYLLAMAGSRTLLGLSDVFLAGTTEPVLPPLATLRAQAGFATSVATSDDAGFHERTRTPFPGAQTLANLSITNLYFGNAPAAIGILLPSLNRAREAANRIKSSSNLRQIGLACKMYANDVAVRAGKPNYPADFAELLRTQEITADVFINPTSGTALPPLPPGANPAEFYGEWAVENGDYVYAGAGKTDDIVEAATTILAYEKPLPNPDGINVLFCDGHVDWIVTAEVPRVFAESNLPSPIPAGD